MNSPSTVNAEKLCGICYDTVNAQPTCKEEKAKILDCSHIFHKECIGTWLQQRHNCPVCRAHVEVSTPEASRPEMTLEEILSVPDNLLFNREILSLIGSPVQEAREIRGLAPNENTAVGQTATRVSSLEIAQLLNPMTSWWL